MIALCRILIEDYIHLSYLLNSPETPKKLLANINNHPKIEAYLKAYTVQEWGIDLTEEQVETLAKAKIGFEETKGEFLRYSKESEQFNPNDYYRTWTKKPLDTVIKESGISAEGNKSELGLVKQMYDVGSDIIHHNAYFIWQLSRENLELIAGALPEASAAIAISTLAKIVNLALSVKYNDDKESYALKLDKLANIL